MRAVPSQPRFFGAGLLACALFRPSRWQGAAGARLTLDEVVRQVLATRASGWGC